MANDAVKIITMIIGGAIAIELLTSSSFGNSVGAITNGFATILSAMRGQPTSAQKAA